MNDVVFQVMLYPAEKQHCLPCEAMDAFHVEFEIK
jgi:hypothetical protein